MAKQKIILESNLKHYDDKIKEYIGNKHKTFSNIEIGSTTISADSKEDTLILEGSNVTLTPDVDNDKVTIGITKDNITTALGYTPSKPTQYANGASISINDLVEDGTYRIYIQQNSEDHNYLGFYGQLIIETFSQASIIYQKINKLSTCQIYLRYTSNQTTTPLSYDTPLINIANIIDKELKITDDGGVLKTVIQVKNPTPNTPVTNGSEIIFFGGGNVFVGGGESCAELRNELANGDGTLYSFEDYTPTAERLYLSADTTLHLYSNCNDITQRKVISMNEEGSLLPGLNNSQNLGQSSRAWKTLYNKEMWLYNNGAWQGYFGNYTLGTTEQKGNTRLILGNNIAAGNDNNSAASIYLYGENKGVTLIKPTNHTESNITLDLPSSSGTIALMSNIPWTRAAGASRETRIVGVYGFISGGSTQAFLYLPILFDRSVSYSSSTFNVNKILCDIRTTEGSMLGGDVNIDLTSYVTETYSYLHQGLVRVVLTKTDGWGVKNNTPLCGDCSIDYTIA